MVGSRGIVICYFIVALFLFQLIPPVQADGIPMYEFTGTLRETRQLAYIEASNNSWESMDLFLSFSSLEVGKNYTVMVPLKSPPTDFKFKETSDSEFKRNNSFDEFDDHHKKQTKAWDKLGEEIGNDFTMGLILNYVGILLFLSTSLSSEYVLVNRGNVKITLYNFNTTSSLMDFYCSKNTTVPDNVLKYIEKYGEYHALIINGQTTPPIDEESFDLIQKYSPDTYNEMKKYVDRHKSLVFRGSSKDASGFFTTFEMDHFGYDAREEAEKNGYHGHMYFPELYSELILNLYGFGTQRGYQMSFNLSLPDGKVFFPLGTSPAWKSISETIVLFSCPDAKEISFDRSPQHIAYFSGRTYYEWSFKGEQTDFDLEGKVGSSQFEMQKQMVPLNEWIYENSPIIALVLVIIFGYMFWTAVTYLTFRLFRSKKKHLVLRSMGLAAFPMTMGNLMPVGAFMYILCLLSFNIKNEDAKNLPRLKRILLGMGIITICLSPQIVTSIFIQQIPCLILSLIVFIAITSTVISGELGDFYINYKHQK